MQNTGARLQKVGETHLRTLYRHWEATERGRGMQETMSHHPYCRSPYQVGDASLGGSFRRGCLR